MGWPHVWELEPTEADEDKQGEPEDEEKMGSEIEAAKRSRDTEAEIAAAKSDTEAEKEKGGECEESKREVDEDEMPSASADDEAEASMEESDDEATHTHIATSLGNGHVCVACGHDGGHRSLYMHNCTRAHALLSW